MGMNVRMLAMRTPDQVAAMPCPVCRVPLVMSDRQGIEIDYCPQCRGVWLDRGELDKIIERSAPAAPPAQTAPAPQAPPQAPYPPQQPHYGHQPHYGGKPYYKKQKHWLSEIFD
jgi:Zn-finger nucleic acid-binding protein